MLSFPVGARARAARAVELEAGVCPGNGAKGVFSVTFTGLERIFDAADPSSLDITSDFDLAY